MANNLNGMQDGGQVNLAQLMQLPGASPIPRTDPIATSSVEDLAAERSTKADVLLDSLNALTAQQARMGQPQSPTNPMGIPKTSIMQEPWMKMAPLTGQGFFGGLKALFGDIGRGALAGVAATGPGQAMQRSIYGPGVARYEAQKQALADRIQTIKEQTQLEQQPIAAFGELAFHKALVASKEELNEIKRQALAEKTQLDQDRTQLDREKLALAGQKFSASRIDADRRFKAAMANINLRAKSLDERTLNDERNTALREYGEIVRSQG